MKIDWLDILYADTVGVTVDSYVNFVQLMKEHKHSKCVSILQMHLIDGNVDRASSIIKSIIKDRTL